MYKLGRKSNINYIYVTYIHVHNLSTYIHRLYICLIYLTYLYSYIYIIYIYIFTRNSNVVNGGQILQRKLKETIILNKYNLKWKLTSEKCKWEHRTR